MSKTILKTLAVVAFAMIAGYNVYQAHSETEGMSELMLANVEALADCESPVKTEKGRFVYINCINSSGETYTLEACDFDSGYSSTCEGRSAK